MEIANARFITVDEFAELARISRRI